MTEGYKNVGIREDAWEALKILALKRRISLQDALDEIIREAMGLTKPEQKQEEGL